MKKILLALLACMTFICLALGSACEKNKPSFNEGYMDVIELGNPIMLDEYVDPDIMDEYTLILRSDSTGEEIDLKARGQWTTRYPGTFTLTYTVTSGENKGTISTKLSVIVPEVEWTFTRNTIVNRVGDTFSFNQLERDLNLSIESYYDYEFFVSQVKFNGDVQTFTDEIEYTFEQEGDYTFTFGIRTEDGQVLSAEQKVNVRFKPTLGEGAADWMSDNNISAYDYKVINADGSVELDAGYYSNSFTNDNVPYLAFNGDYGENTFIKVDFIGKNLPQVAFFCDEVTPSLTDGARGIYIHNGLTTTNGTVWNALDASRLTVFGPNKVGYAVFNANGRFSASATGSEAAPCPMSYNALQEDCQYRYIVGFTDASTSSVTLRILLINLTTMERELDHTYKCVKVDGYGNVDFTDYFNGSIVLYGRYGVETKWDKVYLPITDVEDVYELDVAAEFKKGFRAQYAFNSIARVSDYIEDEDGEYIFKVVDPDGETVNISEGGAFQYEKSGTYRLIYDSLRPNVRASSVTVDVMFDPNGDMGDDYFENTEAIIASGVRRGTGLVANTNAKFIEEGARSIRYYTSETTTDGKGIPVGIGRNFLEFIFLSREVDGISFDVYTTQPLQYKLYAGTKNAIKMDYTGSVAAETWTKITVTRELYLTNSDSYSGCAYALAISFYVEGEELPAQTSFYLDNIQIITTDATQSVTDVAKAFLATNNMTAYGCQSINDDLQVQFYKGMYQGEAWAMKNDDVPYVAYNGNYGVGTYVAVDFTGKNLPQLCFFAKEITPSLLDGLAGVYIHNGIIKNNGAYRSDTDAGRVTFFGPNKVEYKKVDAEGRYSGQFGSADSPSPMSERGLQDGVRYRYVIGVKSAQIANGETKGKVVLQLMLINLDTKTVVADYSKELSDIAFTTEYLSGNVVMYGKYNVAITLDKIYPIYQNVADIDDIDLVQSATAQ